MHLPIPSWTITLRKLGLRIRGRRNKQQLRARRNRHSRHETLEPRILLTATGNTDANDLEANDQEEEVAELLFATDLSSDNITVDTGSFELGSLTDFSPIPYLPLTVTGPLTIEEGETYALQLPSSDTALGEIASWRIDWGDGSITTLPGDRSSATHIFQTA